MRRRLGDRRGRPRFDIVGELWGTLETVMRVSLENIGPGGALLHSHVSLAPDSIHRITLRAGGQDFTTQAKVCHVDSRLMADGERTFLIGVEFLSMHPLLVAQLQACAAQTAGEQPAGA